MLGLGRNPYFSNSHAILDCFMHNSFNMAALSANALKSTPTTAVDDEAMIVLDASDISVGLERCSKSLIGRLLVESPFSSGTIESALTTIWRQPQGFNIINHGGNKFQFFFEDEKDVLIRCAP
ncbi:hypothetical protein PIB30_066549 [Stylosanthes scabra]|uniref:DUF4283 domain-containing protein n=1 Tax=Stylosanthes scabra TaxID=79078 RepID=A0ABU6VKS9_9FABA|nr:hypothetical protein [Stylosanthes scabra]